MRAARAVIGAGRSASLQRTLSLLPTNRRLVQTAVVIHACSLEEHPVRPRHLLVALALALPGFAPSSHAQNTIPVRQLGPILATSEEHFGTIAGVWQFSDGQVLVNDGLHFRLQLLDSSLTRARVIADSNATLKYRGAAVPLIPYARDSVLFFDVESGTMVLVATSGSVARALAHPAPSDVRYLVLRTVGFGSPAGYPIGYAWTDAQRRLIYRGEFRAMPAQPAPGQPRINRGADSAPLLRADFETRTVDTIARIRIRNPATVKTVATDSGSKVTIILNPVQLSDEWAVLSDGTIAIVRSHDYHIDWIDPDGARRSSSKMAFDWRRLSEADKRVIADSQAALYRKSLDDAMKSAPPGRRLAIPEISVAGADEIPEYLSPAAAVHADRDGNLWVLPTTSGRANEGRVYDVINRTGAIVERVVIPSIAQIAGFGPGRIVYLAIPDGANGVTLARARR